jgi:DNA end-binding protein Ku
VTALRSLWNGTLRFEQLQVPVAIAATRSGGDDVELKQLHRACSHPLVQLRECPVHGEVPAEEIVSGWQVSPGEFVVVEADELKQLVDGEDPNRRIEVLQVAAAGDVDSVLVRSAYWLMPTGGDYAHRGYRLVEQALAAERASLIVSFNYRGVKIAAIRADQGALLVEVLAPAADRVPVAPIVDELVEVKIPAAQRKLARELVRAKLQPVDESAFVNARRDALRALLTGKLAAGAETVRPEPAPVRDRAAAATPPADLEAALRRSLDQLRAA